jgi:hypothetical protein
MKKRNSGGSGRCSSPGTVKWKRTGKIMKKMTDFRGNIFLFFLIILNSFLLIHPVAASPGEIDVYAAVEKDTVYVGESFTLQIIINGSNSPQQPQLTGFNDFTSSFQGGYDQSSQKIEIRNGKKTTEIKEVYVFLYELTPEKTGTLEIPPVTVQVGGSSYKTNTLYVTAKKPAEVSHYKFRLLPDRTTCYVGEKLYINVIWYWAQDIKGPVDFHIPLFEDTRVEVLDPPVPTDQNKEYATLVVGNQETYAVKGSAILDGKSYNTYSFKKILVPKKTGTINVNDTTLSFYGVAGDKAKRDSWGRRVLDRIVIPSNKFSLIIRDLPETGKPENFSGLIGDFSLSVRAAPVDVRVGDPITLTITLKGDGYLEDADIPPLDEMPLLNQDFRIPRDIAPGRVNGNEVIFIQTLRPLDEAVSEIPAFDIPYFDVKTGKYAVMKTEKIPLQVQPATNELSVTDMEGSDPVDTTGREIELWEEGIAHNYEGYDILRPQAYGLESFLSHPGYLFLIIFPVITYLILLYIFRFSPLVRKDTSALLVKKTLGELHTTLDKGQEGEFDKEFSRKEYLAQLMKELKAYLGAKLKTRAGALTILDIEKPMEEHGVSKETIAELKKVFETCEAIHYAGNAYPMKNITDLIAQTRNLISGIERSFS